MLCNYVLVITFMSKCIGTKMSKLVFLIHSIITEHQRMEYNVFKPLKKCFKYNQL